MATTTESTIAPWPSETNSGNLDLDPAEHMTPGPEMDERILVNASQRRASQQTNPSARDLMSRFGAASYLGSGSLLPATAATTATQPDVANGHLSPPHVARPKRHAAVKALHTLSVAYQPLIIHAAHSERRSSGVSVDGDVENPYNGTAGASDWLVIDDMLPPADESEGDSDAYEATTPRKRRQMRPGERNKRPGAGADGGSVRRPREKKRVERLDRDDLRLIARAAQGLMGAEERKKSVKSKGKKGEMLTALKRVEAERFVKFVEEAVDWSIAASRLSEVRLRPKEPEGTAEQAELHTTNLGLLQNHRNPHQAILHVADHENVLTAERLREHWRNVLSSRIVSMYLE